MGRVTLVGGGPGRTGLLTLDAVRALEAADVVFYDRLAPTDDLAELAPRAELIDVGKTPYHHRYSQRTIEGLMIARAKLGQSVVRLKGGDAFVFGRGAEELQACRAAGVPVEVIPGVSSAIAAPAAAGIPVTCRGLTRAVTVISGHVPLEQHELDALVRLRSTIVILMGMSTLPQVVSGLLRAGMPGDMPAAVIENAYARNQRSLLARLDRLAEQVRRTGISSPGVIVIGDVVAVAPQFGGEVVAARPAAPPDARIRAS